VSLAIVDRRPSWATFLEPGLRQAGCGLVVLTSGADLLRLLRRRTFRVAVVDTSIDDYPPSILLPALRDLYPRLRVIVTTAYMTDGLREILEDAPPFHTALKPIDAATLRSVIADALELPALVG
jgi:DNA-binding NtrC family response regulator